MIQLVILGNGFDLAHGNKTKYSDFFLFLIKKYYNIARESNNLSFDNEIVAIKATNYLIDLKEITNFVTLLNTLNQNKVKVEFKGDFIQTIVKDITNKNWADIESLYYNQLRTTYNGGASLEEKIKRLNISFDLIKSELIEYLSKIKINPPIDTFKIIFKNIVNQTDSNEQLIFLNFNYTNTLSNYSNFLKYEDFREIKIHGSIDAPKSIIFGYGDESETHYKKLEDANQNFFLDHFKSFHYIQSNNYSKLFELLDMDSSWHTHIIGHSCGVCDRILLKELLDNDKCKRITIYPYKKEDGTLDITEKVQQISRHFTGNSKHKMRRVITYDKDIVIH